MDLETILVKDQETGKSEQARLSEIKPISNITEIERKQGLELSLIDQEDWNDVEGWVERLRPLLSEPNLSVEMVKKVAIEAEVHISTIYRKLALLRDAGRASVLTKGKSDGGKHKSRLAPDVEATIESTIDDFHFNKQKKKRSKKETIEEIKRRLQNAKLAPPHDNTLYNRITTAIRKKKAGSGSGPTIDTATQVTFPGHLPDAEYPLAVVQIDHTPLDIIVVDDVYHLPVGKPWLTLAIDVFSRAVLGFYISLDPPGNTGTGQCIVHAILKKEVWLAGYDIQNPWPCWGVMSLIHVDNAGEFRGDMLKRACKEYSIDLKFRPVKKAHYGAHIERLLGTFLKEIHTLAGTTYSNPEERGEYDSEKHADMTIGGLERWLALFITGVYHQREHSALLTSPIDQYEKGIFGTEEILGRGFPLDILDEDRLRLDLLPAIRRTIQEYGAMIGEIHYYHRVLNRWAKAVEDPRNPKKKRKFIFKRDPRDISVIYFYDPELQQFYRIPYRDTSHPPMSIWEYREVRRRLKTQGKKKVNESMIFETYAQMRIIEEEEARKSKAARRSQQRRRLHQQSTKPKAADDVLGPITEEGLNNKGQAECPVVIKPFDELEEL